jgi:hypothetical protein
LEHAGLIAQARGVAPLPARTCTEGVDDWLKAIAAWEGAPRPSENYLKTLQAEEKKNGRKK